MDIFSQNNIQDYLENILLLVQKIRLVVWLIVKKLIIFLNKLQQFGKTPQGVIAMAANRCLWIKCNGTINKTPLLEVAYHFTDVLDQEFDSQKMKQKLDGIMERELLKLTPKVKEIIEDNGEHLGWLVVWGNVFGLIGLISYFTKLGLSI